MKWLFGDVLVVLVAILALVLVRASEPLVVALGVGVLLLVGVRLARRRPSELSLRALSLRSLEWFLEQFRRR